MAEHKAVLGVGGGIAAYKAAELARALMERGFSVQTVMTDAAQEFVRPLTFAALTGNKVITSMFASRTSDEVLASSVEHIRVAQENQLLVVAPATADLLAKLRARPGERLPLDALPGLPGPVVLAPAMNTAMWDHPATQDNLALLRSRGAHVVAPDDGPLACGTVGAGRLPTPSASPKRLCACSHSGTTWTARWC